MRCDYPGCPERVDWGSTGTLILSQFRRENGVPNWDSSYPIVLHSSTHFSSTDVEDYLRRGSTGAALF